MVFAFPWLGGLPLAFLRARGARRGGYCSRVVVSDVSRLRCVSCASAACAFGVSVARSRPSSQLSIISAGSATEVWSGAAGDVSYRASSAIGMCAGGMVAFLGAKVTI